MTRITPKPFRREGSSSWYFRYTDLNGFRKLKSTGTSNKTKAQQYIRDFIDKLQTDPNHRKTLRQMVAMFCDPETNPRYLDSIANNRGHSPRYIEQITRTANHLYNILDKQRKIKFDRDMVDFNRREVKDIGNLISAKFGHTTKAHKVYKMLKMVFSQAFDDGYIPANIAAHLPDIKAERVKPILSLPAADIRYVIDHVELFASQRERDIFTLIATTGLRRSEVLALDKEQLRPDGSLMIDRSWKDDRGLIVGLPKWNVKRVIPLCKTAKDAAERLFTDNESIGMNSRELYKMVRRVGERAALRKDFLQRTEAWEHIYPHMLRRSLTTMLRASGLSDMLIAEYMSWSHQDQDRLGSQDMLDRYTDIVVQDLKVIADKIELLLSGKDNVIDIKTGSR